MTRLTSEQRGRLLLEQARRRSKRTNEFNPEHPEDFRFSAGKAVKELFSEVAALQPENAGRVIVQGLNQLLTRQPDPGQQFGGIGTAGDVPPSSTVAPMVVPPPVNRTGDLLPPERGLGSKVTEVIAGSAPFKAVKAAVDTPEGALSSPGLAFRRARGAFLHEVQEDPLLSTVEVLGMFPLAKAVAVTGRATAKLPRTVLNVIKDVRAGKSVATAEQKAVASMASAAGNAAAKATGEQRVLLQRQKELLDMVQTFFEQGQLKKSDELNKALMRVTDIAEDVRSIMGGMPPRRPLPPLQSWGIETLHS